MQEPITVIDMIRTYRQLPDYYLWIPGRESGKKVPGDENDLSGLFQEQKKQLTDVVIKDKRKIKKEADLIKTINRYNRLFQTS